MRLLFTAVIFSSLLLIGCSQDKFQDCGLEVIHFGYEYSTVQIGDQCWFQENCRYVPFVSEDSDISDSDSKVYYYSNQQAFDSLRFGALYNFKATVNENLCPNGWRIPSDRDFKSLESSIGMSKNEVDGINWRGDLSENLKYHQSIFYSLGENITDSAIALLNDGEILEEYYPNYTSEETDSAWSTYMDTSFYQFTSPVYLKGFSSLPSGDMSQNGPENRFYSTGYWTSTQGPIGTKSAYARFLHHNENGVFRNTYTMSKGFSCRCMRDDL